LLPQERGREPLLWVIWCTTGLKSCTPNSNTHHPPDVNSTVGHHTAVPMTCVTAHGVFVYTGQLVTSAQIPNACAFRLLHAQSNSYTRPNR
jgi:hypothetical protein